MRAPLLCVTLVQSLLFASACTADDAAEAGGTSQGGSEEDGDQEEDSAAEGGSGGAEDGETDPSTRPGHETRTPAVAENFCRAQEDCPSDPDPTGTTTNDDDGETTDPTDSNGTETVGTESDSDGTVHPDTDSAGTDSDSEGADTDTDTDTDTDSDSDGADTDTDTDTDTDGGEVLCSGERVVDIESGWSHTCAVYDTGAVACWGYFGAHLGTRLDEGDFTAEVPLWVPGLCEGAKGIGVGSSISCAWMDDNSVRCWGSQINGALGKGFDRPSSYDPVPIPGLEDGVDQMSVGGGHICVLRDQEVWCWGRGLFGELGDGSFDHDLPENASSELVKVVGLKGPVAEISVRSHLSCARLESGDIQCWGSNFNGDLGLGEPELGDSSREQATDIVPLGGKATRIFTNYDGACALMENGRLKCWGYNRHTQLGLDTEEWEIYTPTTVTRLAPGVKEMGGGPYHNCTFDGSGAVTCFGSGYYGQLGDGRTGVEARNTLPTPVVGLLEKAVQITGGDKSTCLRLESGRVQCFGQAASLGIGAELGDEGWEQYPYPEDLAEPIYYVPGE